MAGKFLKAAKAIITDPGFGFTLSGIALFAATSPIGLAGCLVATTAIAAMKALHIADPPFMRKENIFTRLVKDERTSLHILGLAMLTVMGATLAQNAIGLWAVAASTADFFSKGWVSTFLPAISSGAFAVADFSYAALISESLKQQKDPAYKTPVKSRLRLSIERPETHIAIATVAAGLIAGGTSLICLPFVASAYIVSLRNIIQERPPYAGHPNMHWATMSGILSGVGFATGTWTLGIAMALDTAYYTRIESLITPGGFRQVSLDIKEGFASFGRKITHKPEKGDLLAEGSVLPAQNAPASSLALSNTLKQNFASAYDATVCAEVAPPEPSSLARKSKPGPPIV